jgi:RimJ/RimL family protein N-acetyltransferase
MGKGYATRLLRLSLNGFENARLKQIVGLAYPDNVASWRILEKVGMRFVGTATYYDIEGLRSTSAIAEQGFLRNGTSEGAFRTYARALLIPSIGAV